MTGSVVHLPLLTRLAPLAYRQARNMCKILPSSVPTQEGVWWQDDTRWRPYNSSHQALIRQGLATHLHEVALGTIVSPVHPTGAQYTVNLQTMQQVAVSSRQRRPIMVVNAVKPEEPTQTVRSIIFCYQCSVIIYIVRVLRHPRSFPCSVVDM